MNISRKQIIIAAVMVLGAAAFFAFDAHRALTFETIKQNRDALLVFARDHSVVAAVLFCAVYLSTAFFVPGALVLTMLGGFLFGTLTGALYANLSAAAGACMAFLVSRYLIGTMIQQRYPQQLRRFNNEIDRHGPNYLLVLRIVPVLPFFLVNYLAGITKLSLPRFMITTFLGMLPGSLVYSYAGRELGMIERPGEIVTTRVLAAFTLMAVLALLPVIASILRRLRSR